ncbi:uncharacterized protein LOC110856004 isoform X1 [Folsomia candida]|uniref:Uncharacterized protein n=1 Tax=Folsomia candida TaxID=158441 RepID=A0A226DNN9_FOLCA|nr:uncharacterized protein LOC110856004 isoform X1 [Folsomia candida]XP_035712624.1 uncharacterized protein LOC110856004 isoform X1 [Folsomia candida]XP_035712626.1 uncharacterized protein LOC110856004 isoform X1 [Folsomia candida]XP_035712627.1 uncharacterized protein LOC110856004 isoform X1 [Folsomia candida]OXA47152.1 hypothetical protein Fcan01_18291 [Folsomia candida]
MNPKFLLLTLTQLIFCVTMCQLIPTIPTKQDELFSKFWKSAALQKYKKTLVQLEDEDTKPAQLEIPDVKFIMEYRNSLEKSEDRAGRQYHQPGPCMRDPWHNLIDKFLLSYYIAHQYGVGCISIPTDRVHRDKAAIRTVIRIMIDRCHLGQGNQTTGITSQNRIILDLMSLTYWNRTTTQNHFLTISLARLVWPETQKIKQKLLDWAATLPDEKPSQRLGFIKDFIGLCTQDELRRLKKMVQLTKRRNAKDSKFSKTKPVSASKGSGQATDAVNSSPDAAIPSVASKTPWWDEYEEKDIIAFDTEMVTKPQHSPNGEYKQQWLPLML